RLVDAVAVIRRAATVVDLAGAGPDHAVRVDVDGADRLRQVAVPRGAERRAAVGRLPDASAAGGDVDDAPRARIRGDVTDAPPDVAGAELAPHLIGARRAFARLAVGLRLRDGLVDRGGRNGSVGVGALDEHPLLGPAGAFDEICRGG